MTPIKREPLDLFGEPMREPSPKPKRRLATGYAAPPGSGPPGETCRSCHHSYMKGGVAGSYYKCGLVRATAGPGTDIRLKSPACRHWRPEVKP